MLKIEGLRLGVESSLVRSCSAIMEGTSIMCQGQSGYRVEVHKII